MKILIAGNDADSRRTLESTLTQWGYEVFAVGDGAAASAALQKQEGPKLAVLDATLTGMDARHVCREVRRRVEHPYTYILLLTEKAPNPEILPCIEAGADDYLTKPVEAEELHVRLRAGRRILELKEELFLAHEAISFQATHDPLTGLSNRAAIVDILRRELARVRREGTPVGVFIGELDHFKDINETYGTLAGDAVLREVARRMRTAVRPYDAIGRYGGEEFLVVVPGCDGGNALSQAERFRTAVTAESVDIIEWGKHLGPDKGKIRFTISAGVAAGGAAKEAESLLHAAETALARAKKAGRNRVELAAPEELK